MATYVGYATPEDFYRGYDNFITPEVVAKWDAIFRADSARALATVAHRELRYGAGERNAIDFFPAAGTGPAPLLVAIHGGLWFLFDKWFMHFLAGSFTREGIHVACINYGLAPAQDLAGIIGDCRAAVTWLRGESSALNLAPSRISVLGHSAAGQIAALVAADASLELHGCIGVSGFYDIVPFAQTPFHASTQFPIEQYAQWNPLDHVSAKNPSTLLITGARESSLLQQMMAHYAAALRAHAVPVETICAPDECHFSVLHEITQAGSPLFSRVLQMLR
jgi:arylformamidase